MHAFTISAEDDKIGGKKEKRPEKSLESSPNTSVEEAKPEAKGQDSGTSLKRAYSLSDLNKPNVPRRILPAPPANGNIKQNTMSPNQRHKPLKCMTNKFCTPLVVHSFVQCSVIYISLVFAVYVEIE